MRALIVDDSSFIREYLRHLLTRMDIVCEEAEDGSDALTMLAAEESGAFDLMLLDVNMPVMNGLECVKALREARLGPQMKVMMVTTEADHSFIETALDNGADEFLMKPFTPREPSGKDASAWRDRGLTGMQKEIGHEYFRGTAASHSCSG